MNDKNIYYSCCTLIAYIICERYYQTKHYVWCTPYFDPSSRMCPQNWVPPTSNPRDIYMGLKKEVEAGDRHSAKIVQNRTGIARGADAKLKAHIIEPAVHREILQMSATADILSFKPFLLIIPGPPIADLLRAVGIDDRASLFSEEFLIEALPRTHFHAIEL